MLTDQLRIFHLDIEEYGENIRDEPVGHCGHDIEDGLSHLFGLGEEALLMPGFESLYLGVDFRLRSSGQRVLVADLQH